MTDWIETAFGGIGRVRPANAHAQASGALATLFITGDKSGPMRQTNPDGSAGGPLTVIGDDDREFRADTDAPPLSMICALAMRSTDGQLWHGTGFLVGRRTIVTAAHNLTTRDRWGRDVDIAEVVVRPGLRPTNPPFAEQTVGPEHWALHPGWNRDPTFDTDFATISLPQDAGTGGAWFGVAALDQHWLIDRMVNLAGYPGAGNTQRDTIPAAEWGKRLYWHADRIGIVKPDALFYDADTSPGQSGAPVVLMPPADAPWAGPTVVGIHVQGQFAARPDASRDSNGAVRITPIIMDMIRDAVAREK